MNPQPAIFISSIISEFYDLRGALHYYLTKSGFRVLMSEESDFGADCNKDALENCKKQITNSDYYLLLIGFHPGTTFSIRGLETSVIFEEYKHFKYLLSKGKNIRLIAFVRKETWNSFEDIKNEKIHPIQKKLISDLIKAPELSEVGIGRWRYTFDKFRDIISVLETNQSGIFLEAHKKNKIFKTYIQRELTDILKAYLEKGDDGVVRTVTSEINLPKTLGISLIFKERISQELVGRLIGFSIIVQRTEPILRKINRIFGYIAQGEFSLFNSQDEKYELPEFIKLINQTLEILERIIENEELKSLRNRKPENFLISGIEYNLIQGHFENLNIVINKLVNILSLFYNDSPDFIKLDDEFYSYGKISGYGMKDGDVRKFVENYFAKSYKNTEN